MNEICISDYELHLAVVCRMLPIFAAANHCQYAKGARLYIKLSVKWLPRGSTLGDLFRTEKLHTVRYNTSEWAGIWTDLSIELNQ